MKTLIVSTSPALDKTYYVDGFTVNGVNRAKKVVTNAGGKAFNLCTALVKSGVSCFMTGFAADGFEYFEKHLDFLGVRYDFVRVDGAVRTNIKICDTKNGTFTDINEESFAAGKSLEEKLFEKIDIYSRECGAVYMGGSLPSGMGKDAYAKMISLGRENGAITVLDASGEALLHGVWARPHIIKPNKSEMEFLTGTKINDFVDAAKACETIKRSGVETVLLSLGDMGAIVSKGDETFTLESVPVKVLSTVGAGDCFLAGFLYGMHMGLSFEEAAKTAVSFSATKVGAEGTHIPEFDDLVKYTDKVKSRKL